VKEGRQFKLRVLLIDFDKAKEIIAARVTLRIEKSEDHIHEVKPISSS
jgi:hypothetical protein